MNNNAQPPSTSDIENAASAQCKLFDKKTSNSAAVFFTELIVIYMVVVVTSIVNLSVQDCIKAGVCNLWIVMLSK